MRNVGLWGHRSGINQGSGDVEDDIYEIICDKTCRADEIMGDQMEEAINEQIRDTVTDIIEQAVYHERSKA